jgi:hypothetical protein
VLAQLKHYLTYWTASKYQDLIAALDANPFQTVYATRYGFCKSSGLQRYLVRKSIGLLGRNEAVFGKTTIARNTNGLQVLAQVNPAKAAVPAHPARNVRVHCHPIPGLNMKHLTANLHNRTRKLVPGNNREPNEKLSIVYVGICSAHTAGVNSQKQFIRAGFRHGSILYLYAPGSC